ncbi:MAG: Fur family transcriptional regulator [Devosia sp.]
MAHAHDDHSGHDHIWAEDLTRNQGLVLGALAHADTPLSAYQLLDTLRADGLKAPLQVYRALDKLVERGLAHRLESLNAFVACADEHCHRTGLIAFAICSDCGKVDEFADGVIEERLGEWAAAEGFKVERTTMEIRGKCAVCVAGHPLPASP